MDGNDTLTGGAGADTLDGGAGNDLLQGGNGDDVYRFNLGGGQDIINDIEGIDTLRFGAGVLPADLNLQGGTGNDTYTFSIGDGMDSISDTEGVNRIEFGAGISPDGITVSQSIAEDGERYLDINYGTSDRVSIRNGELGYIQEYRFAGDVVLTYAELLQRFPSINVAGTSGNDIVDGSAGADWLTGAGGNDSLFGGAGDDWLAPDAVEYWSEGNTYSGGVGNDRILGTRASDLYLFGEGDGQDVIGDFHHRLDVGSAGGDYYQDIDPGYGGGLEYRAWAGIPSDINLWNDPGEPVYTGTDTLRFGDGIRSEDVAISIGDINNGGDLYFTLANGMDEVRFIGWSGRLSKPLGRVEFADGTVWSGDFLSTARNHIGGSDGVDWLSGTAADDFLVGFGGSDSLSGYGGDDVIFGGDGADVLYGGDGADTLSGGVGDDFLDGGLGADAMYGRSGNDNFVVDDTSDTVTEYLNEGVDSVQSSMTYTLAANVENLTLTGVSAINGTGNDLANMLIGNAAVNTLTGGAGDDTLDGGTGADVMLGGTGNDLYIVDNVSDKTTENANEGTDTAQSSLTYTLGANVENLILTGTAAINGTGNELDNAITGNSGNNTLDGGLGDDQLSGGAGDDVYIIRPDEGYDVITDSAGNDSIYFGAALNPSNILSTQYSFAPNDLWLTIQSFPLENGMVDISGWFTGNKIENFVFNGALTLTAAEILEQPISTWLDPVFGYMMSIRTLSGYTMVGASGSSTGFLSGTERDDILKGSATAIIGYGGNDSLIGQAGNDILNGGDGNDKLVGDNGDDLLDGGLDVDTMYGGAGNDTYVVDNAGDIVTENLTEGTDTVQSSLTHTLGANIEYLTLTGTTAINGTGNELANVLRGNSAANTLYGLDGNDTLYAGKDDFAFGGNGDDTLIAENTVGNWAYLRGDGGNDVLSGGAGSNQIWGGGGDDTITGGSSQNYIWGDMGGIGGIAGNDVIYGGAVYDLVFGGGGNDYIASNGGNDYLLGEGGDDVVQGGDGNDTLFGGAGNNLLDGGSGVDGLTGGTGNDLLIGGAGSDTIGTGSGVDLIGFNRGDGLDTINVSTVADNTLSLGGGIQLGDLSFTKSANNLILDTGSSDQIILKDWYANTANHSLLTLQMIEEAAADFNPTGGDVLRDNKIETFNFQGLADRFDQELVANPGLTSWALTNALTQFHLSGSDTAALGGDLAYQYGKNGNLSNVGLTAAQAILSDPAFGVGAQVLKPLASLQEGVVRLG